MICKVFHLGLLMCFVDKLNNWYSVGFCDMGCFNVLFRDKSACRGDLIIVRMVLVYHKKREGSQWEPSLFL